MIHSLFIINTSGDVLMEKHWKSVVPRSVCDYFFEAQHKASIPEDVNPVISTPHHYLISILRNNVFYVSVCMSEVDPLFVIEFLHRAVDIFTDYFSECTESTIKEHYVLVYELLDELLDNGFPLATESNVLKELIKPPNILRSIANSVTGKTNMCTTLPVSSLSNVPWRRAGVKYATNDIFLDLTEEVDAIIAKDGSVVTAEIQGYVDGWVRLSGMPDLTLSFTNPRMFDDVSFHPSVRLRRWEEERVLSFVPPDGQFRLLTYHISGSAHALLPLTVRHNITFREQQGRMDITVVPRQTSGRLLDAVSLDVSMPRSVLSCNVTTTQGKHSFDPSSRLLRWDVGKVDPTRLPNIRGTISLQSGSLPSDGSATINVQFNIGQLAVSGIKVNSLDLYGEKYKPFKGVKYATRNGNFQIRT